MKLERIKTMLQNILVTFNNVTTDKGIIRYDGDELVEGVSVTTIDEEGNEHPAEDGDYYLGEEDGRTLAIRDGKIVAIVERSLDSSASTEPANDEPASEEPANEEPATEEEEEVIIEEKKVETDKGTIVYSGELGIGTEVFIEKEDGNVVAEDGEYKINDKIIVIVDGKVSEVKEVVENSAVNEKFTRVKDAYSESYSEKERKIINAIWNMGYDCYLYEAGDDFAVVEAWDEISGGYKYYRFSISWTEDEEVIVGDYEEVVLRFVPKSSEFAAENRIKELEERVKELENEPADSSAKEKFKKSTSYKSTGDERLDNLMRYCN